MKNINLLLIIFVVMFCSVRIVYADCTNDELNIYKNLAENIKINYEYIENENADSYDMKNLFRITVSNIPHEIMVFENNISHLFSNDSDENMITSSEDNFPGGSNLRFIFYTTDKTSCPNQKIKIQNIKLPVYNEYYNDELCSGIEDYTYCHKIIANKITYAGFKKHVLEYKNNLNQNITVNNKQEKNNIFKNAQKMNWIIIIGVTLVFIILLIIIVHKKRKEKIGL